MKNPHSSPQCNPRPSALEEAKSLRKMIPVARRVLGESHELTLMMRCIAALYKEKAPPLLPPLSVTTLEERHGPRGACWVRASAHKAD